MPLLSLTSQQVEKLISISNMLTQESKHLHILKKFFSFFAWDNFSSILDLKVRGSCAQH